MEKLNPQAVEEWIQFASNNADRLRSLFRDEDDQV
jgi:hypothetical protein